MEERKMIIQELKTEARAVIVGCVCVINSRLSPEEIDRFCIYHPEALRITDEEGNDVFTLDIGDGTGRLSEEGAVFSRATTPEGKATITILIDPDCESRTEAVLGAVGQGFLLLDELEEHLVSCLPDLNREAEEAWDLLPGS